MAAEKTGKKRPSLTPEEKAIFSDLETAKASRPAGRDKWGLFEVRKGDKVCWTYADGKIGALVRICQKDGYTVTEHGKAVQPEKVAALLNALTPSQREALFAEYHAANGTAPTSKPKK